MEEPIKISVEKFKAHLPHYLLGTGCPVMIIENGEPIGCFIPRKTAGNDADLASLQTAAAQLDALLESHGISEDEIVAEFQNLRGADKGKGK